MICSQPSQQAKSFPPSVLLSPLTLNALGTAINWDGYLSKQMGDEAFSSVVDQLLNCACFMYIGAWLPFDQFNNPDLGITPWRLVVLFITILFLRRIPSLLLLYKWVREVDGWREALFSGHFGEQLSPDHSEYTKNSHLPACARPGNPYPLIVLSRADISVDGR